MNETRQDALGVVTRTLAADYGCDEDAFQRKGIRFCIAPEKEPGGSKSRPSSLLCSQWGKA
jgi:hypothetical protein